MRPKLCVAILLATLLLTAFSCGDDPSSPKVEEGTVTLTVNTEHETGQTYYVVFQRANGSVVAQLSLDGAGQAAAEIQDGDMVTLLRFHEDHGEWNIVTITGLQIGQNIQLGRTRPSGGAVVAHTITVDADYPAGVSTLQMGTMCTTGGGGITFPREYEIWEQCMTVSGRLNFLLMAQDAAGARSHFSYAADVPADPSGNTLIDLSGTWRTDWQDFLLHFANTEVIQSGRISVAPYRDGQRIGQLHWESWVANGVSMDFPMQLPTGFPERMQATLQIFEDNAERQIQERFSVDVSSTDYTLTGAPPTITNLVVEGGDTERPTVSWNLSGTTVGADAIDVYINWNTPDESMYWSWEIHVPGDASSVQFPALPDELAAARPPADGRHLDPTVEWIDDSTIAGFGDYCESHVERDGYAEDVGDAKLMTSELRLPDPD